MEVLQLNTLFGFEDTTMVKPRIIARLMLRTVYKGVHLEGLRALNPMNVQLSINKRLMSFPRCSCFSIRNHLTSVIQRICKNIFIPVTVGVFAQSIIVLFDVEQIKSQLDTAMLIPIIK